MRTNFIETLLVSFFPLLMVIADIKDWLTIVAAIVSIVWVVMQIIWKIQNWKK